MRALGPRDAAQLVELGGMGIEIEGAGDQHVEIGVGRLARRRDQVGAGDGAEFGANEDAPPACSASFCRGRLHTSTRPVRPADVMARPAGEAGEGDAVFLMRLLDAGDACRFSRIIWAKSLTASSRPMATWLALRGFQQVDQIIVVVHAQRAVRD